MNPTYFETKNKHIAYIPKHHMHSKKKLKLIYSTFITY